MNPIEYAARKLGETDEQKIKDLIDEFNKKQDEAAEANNKKLQEENAKEIMETKKLETTVETILIKLLANPPPNVHRSLLNNFQIFWQSMPLWQVLKKTEKAKTRVANRGGYNGNNGGYNGDGGYGNNGRYNEDGGCGNNVGSNGPHGSGSGGCSNNHRGNN